MQGILLAANNTKTYFLFGIEFALFLDGTKKDICALWLHIFKRINMEKYYNVWDMKRREERAMILYTLLGNVFSDYIVVTICKVGIRNNFHFCFGMKNRVSATF